MKKDNRGLSLVELVIVVAIMAVVSSLLTVGISFAVNRSAEETAKKISTTLNNARITTMGKNAVAIHLYQSGDYVFVDEVIDGSVKKSTKIGGKGVEVQFNLKDSGLHDLGGASSPLKLSFNRSSGSFKKVTYDGNDEYCTQIKVKKGTRELTIKLEYLTGKVSVQE